MIIIDTLLASPLRGLMFVLKQIDEAVQKNPRRTNARSWRNSRRFIAR